MSRFLSSIFAVVLLAVSVVPLASAGEAAKVQPAKSSLASKAMTDQELDKVTAAGIAPNFSFLIPPRLKVPDVGPFFSGANTFQIVNNCVMASSPAFGGLFFSHGC